MERRKFTICDETTFVSQTLVVLSAKPHGFMIYL